METPKVVQFILDECSQMDAEEFLCFQTFIYKIQCSLRKPPERNFPFHGSIELQRVDYIKGAQV